MGGYEEDTEAEIIIGAQSSTGLSGSNWYATTTQATQSTTPLAVATAHSDYVRNVGYPPSTSAWGAEWWAPAENFVVVVVVAVLKLGPGPGPGGETGHGGGVSSEESRT